MLGEKIAQVISSQILEDSLAPPLEDRHGDGHQCRLYGPEVYLSWAAVLQVDFDLRRPLVARRGHVGKIIVETFGVIFVAACQLHK